MSAAERMPATGGRSPWQTAGALLGGMCLMLAAAGAHAQASDAERCRAGGNNPDVVIKHCTAAIGSGKFAGEELARLYESRSEEWANKGDYDRAISDASAALKHAPKMAQAHYQRGLAWANKGDYDRAIADFDAALQLRPGNASVHASRAVEYSVKGDYARAIADFDAALKIDPKATDAQFARGRTLFYMSEYARAAQDIEAAFKAQPNAYVALWLYLARKRGGVTGAEALLERDMSGFRGGWPFAVAVLYDGRTDPQSVAVAAGDSDPVRRRELGCEANFYIAHWHLGKGERADAHTRLQNVQRECPKNILEYEGAVAELRRLAQTPAPSK
jgi:lipoprotein NlpI